MKEGEKMDKHTRAHKHAHTHTHTRHKHTHVYSVMNLFLSSEEIKVIYK